MLGRRKGLLRGIRKGSLWFGGLIDAWAEVN